MWDNEVKEWDNLYKSGSSRYANEGDAGIYYRFPKFAEMFYSMVPLETSHRVLELGGGIGEMYDNLSSKGACKECDYTITEYSEAAVSKLKTEYKSKNNVHVARENAECLSYDDKTFDVVLAFDVMHHVDNPQAMADEMFRVSSKYVFLCEPNGTSILRKITELSSKSRELGEKSYTPKRFREFFCKAKKVYVIPFYFLVPPKTKRKYLTPFIIISEIGQRIPLLKWVSTSLAILVEK